ncbi:hypothetical protein [Embleya sp. NPDC001921]
MVVPTIVLGVLGWRHRALADDGVIFLRTVRQILAGNGPVLNVDERVEANTSTLWQWLLVLLGAITPGDLGFVAVMAGLVLTTAGVAVALDATRRLYTEPAGRLLLPAGVLVPMAVPVFWDYATAGLDTGLGTFWLAGCWWLLVRSRSGTSAGRACADSVWYGLGVLVRPDLALVTGVFLVGALLVARPGRGACVARIAAASALPIAYEILRAGYYGLLVPMPALTKEAGTSDPGRGMRYLWDFTAPYVLYVPALLFLAVFAAWSIRSRTDRRKLVVPLTPIVSALVVTVYVINLGGDYMHARMLLPAMFLALMPGLLLPATRRTSPVAALVGVWAVACVGPWHPAAYHGHDASTTARVRDSDIRITGTSNADHTRDWVLAFPGLRESTAAGLAANRPVLLRLGPDGRSTMMLPLNPDHAPARVSIPGGFLGVTGQVVPLDQYIVEIWGLANTVGAHLEYTPGWQHKWPGHRKHIDDVWLLALELDPATNELPAPGVLGVDPENLAAARHALSCGDLKELLDSTRAPLSPSRFLRNLAGSYHRTTLRIPRDPVAAEHKFCGDQPK